MRRAARIDAIQPAVVEALRKAGAFVQQIHTIGHGCPDLLVRYQGMWHLLELKDADKPPSERRLTPAEADWHARAGRGAVEVVESIDEALDAVGA